MCNEIHLGYDVVINGKNEHICEISGMLLSMASFMWSEQVKWRGMVCCGVIMLTFVLSSPNFMCQV
jgi:hypothetical protein